jgi:prepilin-type N-terminal cleavage/methylation domain-containing protein
MKTVKQSFTLVEILVVIVIIGILSSFIFFTINDSVEKASIAKSKMFSESIRNNLLLNLVSEWKFDDSTNLGLDSWGSNNGTNHGATAITDESQCVSGGCASFDGDDDYISIANNSTLNFNTSDFTIAFWAKVNTVTNNAVFISKDWTDGVYAVRIIGTNYSGVIKALAGTTAYPATYAIKTNKWEHITMVVDRDDTVILYQDITVRTPIDISVDQSKNISPSTSLYLGYSHGYISNVYLDGFMDEIQIYNAAISESQIKQNYLSGLNNLYTKGLITSEEYNQNIQNYGGKN